MNPEPIPRLPVFGWQALAGDREAATPCLLTLPGLRYTTSGRAAILLALETLGIGPGDGVLLPTYHCPTMVAPAADRGATPRFYPIDDCGAPQLAWLRQQDLRGVRAMLVAHFFGLPQNLAPVRAWCQDKGIALIEDCAHALFGRSGARPIGGWGDVAIASLTKFLPVPEGGCLIVNNGGSAPALTPCSSGQQLQAAIDIVEVGAAQGRLAGLNGLVSGTLAGLRRLRGARPRPGALPNARAPVVGGGQAVPVPAEAAAPGVPLGPADMGIDTALAHRELTHASRWVGQHLPRQRIVLRRRQHYETLSKALAGHPGLHPLRPLLPPDCAPYVFPLWVDRPDPGYAELRRQRMPVFRWDRLWPDVPRIAADHGLDWSHHVLQLACHQDLSELELQRFVQSLLGLYAR
jgi:hypothetical protein